MCSRKGRSIFYHDLLLFSWLMGMSVLQYIHPYYVLRSPPGALRNISSAGEPARQFMRSTTGMVDTLLWLLKAGVQQKTAADEKVRCSIITMAKSDVVKGHHI